MTGFKRAERKQVFIKLAITGASGSGKTYSALQVAFGLGQRVALIDTENSSASLYAALGAYDVCEIGPPFTVAKYVGAIQDAAGAGYDVLIIDSLSHAWAGEGGLLAQKESLDARGGNSFTNWASITRQHEAFKAAILQAPIHVLATMRSKTEYVVEQSGGGKSAPKKVGTAPIQREGMDFEFTVVWDLAADHSAIASKDRTGLFDGMNAKLTEEHGRQIAAWLNSAAPAAPARSAAAPAAPPPPRTPPPNVDPRTGEIRAPDHRSGGAPAPAAPATPYADHTMAPAAAPPPAGPRDREDREARVCALLDECGRRGWWGAPGEPIARFLDYAYDEKSDEELFADETELSRLLAGESEAAPAAPSAEDAQPRCAECAKILTVGQAQVSRGRFDGVLLCPIHQRARQAA